MSKRTPIVLAAALFLAGAPAAHAGACKKVKGTFVSAPTWPCGSPLGFCTAGSLGGKLHGSYVFSMATLASAGDPTVPGVMFYTGTSHVTLDDGTSIVGTDTGVVDLDEAGTTSMAAILTFVSGPRGHLVLRGSIDFATFTVSGRYHGEICK